MILTKLMKEIQSLMEKDLQNYILGMYVLCSRLSTNVPRSSPNRVDLSR